MNKDLLYYAGYGVGIFYLLGDIELYHPMTCNVARPLISNSRPNSNKITKLTQRWFTVSHWFIDASAWAAQSPESARRSSSTSLRGGQLACLWDLCKNDFD